MVRTHVVENHIHLAGSGILPENIQQELLKSRRIQRVNVLEEAAFTHGIDGTDYRLPLPSAMNFERGFGALSAVDLVRGPRKSKRTLVLVQERIMRAELPD